MSSQVVGRQAMQIHGYNSVSCWWAFTDDLFTYYDVQDVHLQLVVQTYKVIINLD